MKQKLIAAILDSDVSRAVIEAKKLHNAKIKPERIIKEAFREVITELDKKCTIKYFKRG